MVTRVCNPAHEACDERTARVYPGDHLLGNTRIQQVHNWGNQDFVLLEIGICANHIHSDIGLMKASMVFGNFS